jgi:dTDP-4-amino-4,6-dideoxy-D-galactose acyltransferase
LKNNFQILRWDTDFFGFIVARIIPCRLTKNELENILVALKRENVSLAYWASDPQDHISQCAANSLGGFLADKKITYLIDLVNAPIPSLQEVNANIEEYQEAKPNSELEALALKSGIFSRFNVDPKFSKVQYENLYKLWILNSANKKLADVIFVAKENDKIIGMVTVIKKHNCGNIGITAVDESRRGENLGVALVRMVLEWCILQDCKIAKVVTQADNIAACRLYEKCGYYIAKINYFYHFWL